MDVKQILNIGVGRCGNKLVDDLMKVDKRYSGLFVNTAIGDMTNLSNYDRVFKFLIPDADGSGRDREMAKDYIKNNVYRFADEIIKYKTYDLYVMYFSMDGGTGSGCTPTLIRAMRKVLPSNKKIMVVGVMPSKNSSKLALQNTIACWNELMELRNQKAINGFRFVDNDKREFLEEINKGVITDLDTSFKLNTFDIDGVIDQQDSFRINTADEYGIVLNLNNHIDNFKLAIEDAKNNSVFVMPFSYDCDYLGLLLQNGRYNLNEARKTFSVYETDYCGNSNGRNIVVATGFNIPASKIEDIQQALAELNKKTRERVKDSSLFISSGLNAKSESAVDHNDNTIDIKGSSVSSEDLNRLFNDDFWS